MALNPANPDMLPQDAKLLAQFIAMAPFVFQTAYSLREFGILKNLADHPEGLSFEQIQQGASSLSRYSIEVLLDAAESSQIIKTEKNETQTIYFATQTGVFLEKDKLTRVNMNFSQDVCYDGLFHLKEALETNTPAGLQEFGKWPTIYEGLTQLPEQVQKSWFEFDHFYSDDCFPRALPVVFKEHPKKILDVGANTGKFAMACFDFSPEAHVTLVDHPAQLQRAKQNIESKGHLSRAQFAPMNLLDHQQPLPEGYDVVWMSQFLSCFSEEDVVQLLIRGRRALAPNGLLMVMETFTDNQKFNSARFCLDMTSLYFTVMANGNSRMYRSERFTQLLKKAELEIVEEIPHIRLNHTILKCRAANGAM